MHYDFTIDETPEHDGAIDRDLMSLAEAMEVGRALLAAMGIRLIGGAE